MAQKVVTIYTDDLTGEETQDTETHTLALDGVSYELDLGPDSYDQLLDAVQPFLKAGRKQPRTRKTTGGAKKAPSGPDTAKIREWAKEQGYEVNDRGRVPTEIREAYGSAH